MNDFSLQRISVLRRYGNCLGFTLLELLISITVIGIIMLIVTGAARLGYRSIDTGEKKAETLERFRTSFMVIDAQIQSEIPLVLDTDTGKKYYFKGTSELLQFATNYSLWGGITGYIMVTYQISSSPEGKQVLTISESRVGPDQKREARLLGPVDKISFEYFEKDPTEEKGTWVGEWTEETVIPDKVKIMVKDNKRELSLIIPMRARGTLAKQPKA